MRHHEIVGYTYEAAFHCVDCTTDRFGACPCEVRDVHGEDSEGNDVHPVFAGEEAWESETCDDCGELLGEDGDG